MNRMSLQHCIDGLPEDNEKNGVGDTVIVLSESAGALQGTIVAIKGNFMVIDTGVENIIVHTSQIISNKMY